MQPKRKPVKQSVVNKPVIVKDAGMYSALECWAVSVNEMYNALLVAGFSKSYALGIVIDKSPIPNWLFPNFDPFDDDDELDDLDDD